jgi:hypothetical protein
MKCQACRNHYEGKPVNSPHRTPATPATQPAPDPPFYPPPAEPPPQVEPFITTPDTSDETRFARRERLLARREALLARYWPGSRVRVLHEGEWVEARVLHDAPFRRNGFLIWQGAEVELLYTPIIKWAKSADIQG